jgi:very-short-patch-repair endonuclease
MSVVLSHMTAFLLLRRWDFLAHAPIGKLCPQTDFSIGQSALPCRPSPAQAQAILQVRDPLARPEQAEAPLFSASFDVLCADVSRRSQARSVHTHLWAHELPSDLARPIQPGLLVSGPELCFVQLAAAGLSRVQLALAGCALLSTYATSPASPYGVVQAAPQTTLSKLSDAIERLEGARGAAGARECAQYLLAGAASPMETRVGLYLSLPKCLGGHGLPRPTLNYRYDMEGSLRAVSDCGHYRTDLCWPDASLAVEYDSDAAHTGPDRIASDTQRRNVLAATGITVLGVTHRHTKSRAELDGIAKIIASHLGVDTRERRSDQQARRERLYEELFRGNWGLV